MYEIFNILQSNIVITIIIVINLLLIVLYIINSIKLSKIKNNYLNFMKKIGNGNNIDEMLKRYVKKVEEVDKKNDEIVKYCESLDKNISNCIQKVGIVRYSAFKDTGSDLSFAVALLDQNNDGVVFNGIYSREMSNIYAKPIKRGISTYKMSEEEIQAIKKAIEEKNILQ